MNHSIEEIRQKAIAQIYRPLQVRPSDSPWESEIGYQISDAISELLAKIDKRVTSKTIHPWMSLNTLKSPVCPACEGGSSRARVGVFPLAANPVHWGHVVVSLFAIAELSLDNLVLLAAGAIDYKPLRDCDRIGESCRHEMLLRAVNVFEPLFRYTDVACGTENVGEVAVHDLRALNRDRPLDFVLVWGVEGEERLQRIVQQTADSLENQNDLGEGCPHRLSIAFLRGIEPINKNHLTPARISTICKEARLNIPVRLVEMRIPLLAKLRSTYYREQVDPFLVPASVHQFVIQSRLYTTS
jgi:hypothetical protein